MRSSPPRSVAALPSQQHQSRVCRILFYFLAIGVALSVIAILTSPQTYNTHVSSAAPSLQPIRTKVEQRTTVIPSVPNLQTPQLSSDDQKTAPQSVTIKKTRSPKTVEKSPVVQMDHGMSDEELLRRASKVRNPKIVAYGSRRVPKVAFLFLTRGELPFAPLWDKFFRTADPRHYSVYIHSDPNFNWSSVKANPPEDVQGSVFFRRRIPSKEVEWGQLSMLDAERRLLANALLDPSNQRFLLLSEACIPLYNFSTVYSHLVNSTTTFVESYDDPGPTGRGRYSPGMSPTITIKQWRKGSQWFEVNRRLAQAVVADVRFYGEFGGHRRRCYADEHYIPTLVASTPALARRNANRSVTWVDWSRAGPHPGRFWRGQVTPEFLTRLRDGDGQECDYNGRRTKLCFLFARKFLPNSHDRLMRFSWKVLGF